MLNNRNITIKLINSLANKTDGKKYHINKINEKSNINEFLLCRDYKCLQSWNKASDIGLDEREKILNMFELLDYDCQQHIINMYMDGIFDFDEDIYVEGYPSKAIYVLIYGSKIELLIYIFDNYKFTDENAPDIMRILCRRERNHRCGKEADYLDFMICRLLDIYVSNGLNLEKEKIICSIIEYYHIEATVKIINIWIEKSYNYKNISSFIIFDLFKNNHISQEIINIYIENNIDLETENSNGERAIHIIFKNGTTEIILDSLRIWEQHSFSLDCLNYYNESPLYYLLKNPVTTPSLFLNIMTKIDSYEYDIHAGKDPLYLFIGKFKDTNIVIFKEIFNTWILNKKFKPDEPNIIATICRSSSSEIMEYVITYFENNNIDYHYNNNYENTLIHLNNKSLKNVINSYYIKYGFYKTLSMARYNGIFYDFLNYWIKKIFT